MKTIIAGPRHITDPKILYEAIQSCPWEITSVISGGAKGIDSLAIEFAEASEVPLEVYRANWHKHGKAAGPIRNRKMAKMAEALLAVWDNESKGTGNVIDIAEGYDLRIHIYNFYAKEMYSLRNDLNSKLLLLK